jgi:hypothetical protein
VPTFPVSEIPGSQRRAAFVVGVSYLVAMAVSMLGEGYIRGTIAVPGDAAITAQNLMANRGLFRLAIATELLTSFCDVALVAGLYIILAPVDRALALFAAAFRIVASSVSAVMAANSFDTLRILAGTDYLNAFTTDQLAALARLTMGNHGASYSVVFIFLGIGSTMFGVLWYRSALVPRVFGVLGIVGSASLAIGTFATLMAPGLRGVIYPFYMLPLLFCEVGLGVWLVTKGLRLSVRGAPSGTP